MEETRNRKLRTAEAAAYLGIAKRTLYKWAEERRIPFYRLGATLYFDRQELDDFITTNRVAAE